MQVNAGIVSRSKDVFQGKRQLKQDLEHITEQMYLRNKELADTNRSLSLLRAIDEIALESHTSIKQVCTDISKAIHSAADYPFVGLLIRSLHDEEELTLHGWSSPNDQAVGNLLSRAPIRLKTTGEWLSGPTEQRVLSPYALTPAEISVFVDRSAAIFTQLSQLLNVQALYLSKLIVRHHLVGLLVVGFPDAITELNESDNTLLSQLSDSVGVAIDNKLLFEENQHVLRQLRETNQKLRELDDTKDDFISMASHQLRTPLTSVKGYLSMMIDGDAGTVNPVQDKMLHQAYISAQRMVFLITDLLNVSRLKTGKFIIDARPTNLAKLIEEEVEQLIDTAKAKKLTLQYSMPREFPELMLDEVKIRQVVMNFIDNAIYYTPEGGHIDIDLSDTPKVVELRITDDGIGVPKDDRPHLFTKFYRAVNARKARPDGTGLGLFMAQKVIIAQGGSVIFESKEGKGSTFGFSFPMEKLRVPESPEDPEASLPPEA